MLVVTVSSKAGPLKGRQDRWSERLRDYLPYAETDATLDDSRVGEISLDALQGVGTDTLAWRDGGWKLEQILRMRYRDGARMVTWAGVVTRFGRKGTVVACRFSQLPFVRREGRGTYRLDVPNLTPVERALIDSKLPSGIRSARATLRRYSIPEDQADALRNVYRHAPRFVETFA